MKILCFGDSNTYGFNPVNYKRYNTTQRFSSLLQTKLGSSHTIIENGECGRAIVTSKNAIMKELNTHSDIDIIILMLGTNDCNGRFQHSDKMIKEHIEDLLINIKKVYQGEIILVVPFIILDSIINNLNYDMDECSHAKSVSLIASYKELSDQYNCQYVDSNQYGSASIVDSVHIDIETHKILSDILHMKINEIIKSDIL